MSISGINGTLAAETTINVKKKSGSESSSDFAKTLTDAMESQLVESAITAASPSGMDSAGGTAYSSGEGLMSLIMAAGAEGDIGQAEIALMMLCSMMQSSGSGSAELMSAMAALFSSLQDAELVRTRVMLENYSPEVLDAMDKAVFGYDGGSYYTTPNVSESGSAVIPSEAWRPTVPAVTSGADDRSAGLLREVIDQFGVETSERYRPYRRGNDTYCNIFVWDVTSALGCEIPHFVDSATGQARTYPDITGAYELDANGVCDWLANQGRANGWREVSAEEAQRWANEGKPAVTAYKNSGGIGHVQVVCPSQNGGYDPVRGVTVAQAGSSRYNYAYISSTFGAGKLSSVRYYIHD